jgi:hypothetical protein
VISELGDINLPGSGMAILPKRPTPKFPFGKIHYDPLNYLVGFVSHTMVTRENIQRVDGLLDANETVIVTAPKGLFPIRLVL